MPLVDGKHYPYTEKGKKQAAAARQNKMGGGMVRKRYSKGGTVSSSKTVRGPNS